MGIEHACLWLHLPRQINGIISCWVVHGQMNKNKVNYQGSFRHGPSCLACPGWKDSGHSWQSTKHQSCGGLPQTCLMICMRALG